MRSAICMHFNHTSDVKSHQDEYTSNRRGTKLSTARYVIHRFMALTLRPSVRSRLALPPCAAVEVRAGTGYFSSATATVVNRCLQAFHQLVTCPAANFDNKQCPVDSFSHLHKLFPLQLTPNLYFHFRANFSNR